MEGIKAFQNLQPNNLVEDLIKYIEKEIVLFTSSIEFADVLKKKKNENQHSLAFCVFMTNRCQSWFCFQRENSQKASSTVDIGVYFGSNLIFTIEAKLLPTPMGSKKPPREEHEYVYGKGAGIQRFKEGKHGLDNQDEYLKENGMIAYVLQNDFQYWFGKINQWIIDSRWECSEKLAIDYSDSTAKLISKHKRVDKSEFVLHHFWVNVSNRS